jgi:hypothetical protein
MRECRTYGSVRGARSNARPAIKSWCVLGQSCSRNAFYLAGYSQPRIAEAGDLHHLKGHNPLEPQSPRVILLS